MNKKKTKPVKKPVPERLYTYTELAYILNEFYWLMRYNNNSGSKAYDFFEGLKKRTEFGPGIADHSHTE